MKNKKIPKENARTLTMPSTTPIIFMVLSSKEYGGSHLGSAKEASQIKAFEFLCDEEMCRFRKSPDHILHVSEGESKV